MNQHEDAAVVVRLARLLGDHRSWCGATHLQKTAYFLKELTGVPLDYDFILYKHGPFSFGLQDEISHLLAYDLLELKQNEPPYGPTLVPGRREGLLMRSYGEAASNHREHLEFIAKHLGPLGVVDLEQLGTALWVTRQMDEDASVDERAERVHELKKHIPLSQALKAVARVDQMADAWTTLRT